MYTKSKSSLMWKGTRHGSACSCECCAEQVYELDAFKVTHATKYPGPILSVAISPNAALLAVGLADGQLFVRKHSHNKGAVPGLPGILPAAEPNTCSARLKLT